MRSTLYFLMALVATILFSACSQETPPVVETVKPVETKSQPLTEQTKQAVAEVKEQVKDAVSEIKQEASAQVSAVKLEANKKIEAVKAEAAVVIEQTKVTSIAAVNNAKQGTISALAGLTDKAPSAAKPPEVVIYEASMGKVTFNHGAHSAQLDCSKCHSTLPPQKVAMTKTLAHTLCKGCHKVSGGKAPTACAGCHKK